MIIVISLVVLFILLLKQAIDFWTFLAFIFGILFSILGFLAVAIVYIKKSKGPA